jgi:hypothetical protein
MSPGGWASFHSILRIWGMGNGMTGTVDAEMMNSDSNWVCAGPV